MKTALIVIPAVVLAFLIGAFAYGYTAQQANREAIKNCTRSGNVWNCPDGKRYIRMPH